MLFFFYSLDLSLTIHHPSYYVLAWGTQDFSIGWLQSSSQQNKGLFSTGCGTWSGSLEKHCSTSICNQQRLRTSLGGRMPQPPCHLPDNTCPPSFTYSMQTDQKDPEHDLQLISIFTSNNPYGDALSAHSNPLCMCMHTWPKNTWLADTFKHGGNQMPKFPNAFAIWEHK